MVDAARRFRASWSNKILQHARSSKRFGHSFALCMRSDWIPTNLTSHLKPPKITEPPTALFTREEFASILHACDLDPDKQGAVRLRAFVRLLRYRGQRIRDGHTEIARV